MTTANQIYLMKKLEERYGSVGKVAGRYLAAGLSVEFMHPTRYGPIHIVVRGNNSVFAIDVFDKPGKLSIDDVKTLIEKARLIKAKPILFLYSSAAKVDDDVYKFCIENGVKIKMLKKE
ncbi:hypothetical protein QPL79_07285 [Ignisphaera sp. 4213-co]|uniref:Uncharacterized protein n=1 Tax=Ignisphaera cupida TaxID=3050454 RepID=A0ABD4Z9B6_9CREN|nr:hypothetical protein [Ignisphaera sp. 4213-co]MDK6029163.1 hypothetical protein [Ignisphaera sp. 4213-co]